MNQTHIHQVKAAEPDSPDLDEELALAKDVSLLAIDAAPGESETTFHLRCVFTLANYTVKQIVQTPIHPVWVIRVVSNTAPPIADSRLLVRPIRNLIRRAGFPVKQDEMSVHQNRDGLLVTFVEPPACERYRNTVWNGDLAEFLDEPI